MQQIEIRIKGQLDERRSDWFEGLAIHHGVAGETILTGPVVDQTALFGLLTKIRNLGLALVSVQVSEGRAETPFTAEDGGVR